MQTIYRNYSYEGGRRLAVARPRPRQAYYAIVALVIIGIGIAVTAGREFFFKSGGGGQGITSQLAAANSTEAPDKQPEPPKRQVDIMSLKASLTQTIKKYPYNTSVSVLDLNSNTLIQVGDSHPYIAASTTKLLTALLYLDNVESGKANLDTLIDDKPAGEQLRLAINQSDNDALIKLNTYLGRENLGSYAKAQGINSYNVEKNTITSDDMAQLMAYLYTRQLLNDQHTKLLFSWMQQTSEERFIPPGVPAGTAIYHKAGYLPERVHDTAIIDNGSTPFVLVIYSKSYTASYDYLAGQKLFKEVTEQVLDIYK